jgi:hypothetical protein
MGAALKIEPSISSMPASPSANGAPRAAIRVVGRDELTDDELEVLDFRCQGLQARVDLDAMRIEALLCDCQQPALTDIQ